MALPVFFKTIEEIIDSSNPNIPVVKLSTAGASAFGGSLAQNYILPENAGGTTFIGSHVGADNSRIFNAKTDVSAKMALLFNSHGGYVTPNFGQAVTSPNQPFNFTGVALTPSQAVSDNWNMKTFGAGSLPAPRDFFGMAYLESNQKVIIFGGDNNGSVSADTWSWDGTTWVQINPVSSPTARRNFSMSYDSTRKVIVLFGGQNASNTYLSDTWEFNGTNWAQITTAHFPTARADYAMKYDSTRGKMVLFGGRNGSVISNDTWEYNGTDWTQITTGTSPNIRFQHTMAFDSSRNKTIIFGGRGTDATLTTQVVTSNVLAGDTVINVVTTSGVPASGMILIDNEYISYTGTTSTTFTGCTRGVFGSTPAGHLISAFVRVLVVFGDTWEYDGTNWTQIFLTGSLPVPRSGAKLVYNSTRKLSVLFGGISNPNNSRGDLADTWEYDGVSWTQINIFGPSPRENFGMTYDSNRDKIVLFGGQNTSIIGANGETWEFGSPLRPVVVQTSGDVLVYYDATSGRPVPVHGDFLGPSSVLGTTTPLYDGYSPVFGVALEAPVPYSTTLSVGITSFDTTIAVGTTTGFPGSGTIIIDNEQITYTATTSTTFTGCTRGTSGSTAAVHVTNTVVYSTAPLNLTLNGSTVGIIKMRIRPFYGFIPPLPPSITGFSPNAAIVGDTVTLIGTVFIGTTQITINGTPSANASFNVISNNQITFTVPAGAQKGTITVTNAQGNSTSAAVFTTLPRITSVVPNSGSVGAVVTINGNTFTHATGVTFNGITASFSITNDSAISATIPAGGTSGDVAVTINYGGDPHTALYHNFGVVPPPTITNVAPLAGAIGAFVGISGSGYTAASVPTVEFVDVATMTQILPAAKTIFNDTTISAIVPNPGIPQPSTAYYVRITTTGGVVLSSQQYTIIPVPKFHTSGPTPQAFSPISGVAGTTVNIIGDYGFTGAYQVTFDGYASPSIHFVNDGYITAVVPTVSAPTDAVGAITVTSTGGTRSTADAPSPNPINFTILQSPTITSFSPISGKTGDLIAVFGTNLLSVNSVRFQNMSSSATFSIVNSGRINVTVPAPAATTTLNGGIDNAVTTITVVSTSGFFSPGTITIESEQVTYTGMNGTQFTGCTRGANSTTAVSHLTGVSVFGGTGILPSPTLIHIIADKGPFEITSTGTFLYYPPPTGLAISSPAADGGGINGGAGTSVTITGSNLTQGGTPTVTLGGANCSVTSASPGNVIFTAPSSGVSNSNLTLTTAGGVAGPITFNYLQPCYVSSFQTTEYYWWTARVNYGGDTVDVYGSNFRPSPNMTVYVIDPQQGNASVNVPFSYIDSGHFSFDSTPLYPFAGFYPDHSCTILVITYYPGGSYSSTVSGLVPFYQIG